MVISVPFQSVPWFKLYNYKPSVAWDDKRKVWYLCVLGNRVQNGHDVENSFCQYPFAWEPPYTSLRHIVLEAPVVHATMINAANTLWIAGIGSRGFCFQDVPGGEDARVLGDDELDLFIVSSLPDYHNNPIQFPHIYRVPRTRKVKS